MPERARERAACPIFSGQKFQSETLPKIDLHRRKRTVLDELFKAMLHKLMSGEIKVGELGLAVLPTAEEGMF